MRELNTIWDVLLYVVVFAISVLIVTLIIKFALYIFAGFMVVAMTLFTVAWIKDMYNIS